MYVIFSKFMAEPTGFEPAVSCVTGRHVRPLHHGSAMRLTWCRREDLNPQPTDYKSVALPVELQRQIVPRFYKVSVSGMY
jgi:hypothetical protein